MAATRIAGDRSTARSGRLLAGVVATVVLLGLTTACEPKARPKNLAHNQEESPFATPTPTTTASPTPTPAQTFDGTADTLQFAGPTDAQVKQLLPNADPVVPIPSTTPAAFWPGAANAAMARTWTALHFRLAEDFVVKQAPTDINVNVSMFGTAANAASAAAAWKAHSEQVVRSKLPRVGLTLFTVQGRANETGFSFPISSTSTGVELFWYKGPILVHLQGLGATGNIEGFTFVIFNDTFAHIAH